jgi:hypothetical protein
MSHQISFSIVELGTIVVWAAVENLLIQRRMQFHMILDVWFTRESFWAKITDESRQIFVDFTSVTNQS